mmetsp:Transcript_16269/g.22424  ORF Transcript_16269/g.22424 Transcript_16269/m.22424 type:complete len:262 (-) Transcript_16269:1526-2311(-)
MMMVVVCPAGGLVCCSGSNAGSRSSGGRLIQQRLGRLPSLQHVLHPHVAEQTVLFGLSNHETQSCGSLLEGLATCIDARESDDNLQRHGGRHFLPCSNALGAELLEFLSRTHLCVQGNGQSRHGVLAAQPLCESAKVQLQTHTHRLDAIVEVLQTHTEIVFGDNQLQHVESHQVPISSLDRLYVLGSISSPYELPAGYSTVLFHPEHQPAQLEPRRNAVLFHLRMPPGTCRSTRRVCKPLTDDLRHDGRHDDIHMLVSLTL